MPNIQVQHEGQALDVSLDSVTLPDGYQLVGPDDAPEGFMPAQQFQMELQRRTKNLVRPDDLVADDDFFRRAAEKRGIQLSDDLKPVARLDPEQLARQRQQWEAEHLKPIQEQLSAFQEQAQSARRGLLMRDIMQAAQDVGVKSDRMKSLFGDGPSEFVQAVAGQFDFDEERQAFFFKDQAGNPVYAEQPTKASPYAGPKRLLEMLRKQDKDGLYFEDRRPGYESGYGRPGGGRPAYVLTREEARDTTRYRQAREAAAKEGKTVEILD